MLTLFYLYFIGLLTSISVMDAMGTLIMLTLVYQVYKKQASFFALDGIAKFYLLWIVAVILSLAVNHPQVHWARGLADLKWMLLSPFVAWAAAALDFKTKFFQVKKLPWFYWPVFVVSAYAILISILGIDLMRPHRRDLLPISDVGGTRTPGFLDNPMTFAHSYGILFCMLWAMSLYLLNELKSQLKKIDIVMLLVCLLLTAIALFLSFTRGAWLSIGISLLCITWLYKPRWGFYVLAAALFAVGLVTLVSPTVQARLHEVIDFKVRQNDRMQLWQANWQMFLDHPLTGVGYGENFFRLDEYFAKLGIAQNSFKSHAHNQILQYLAGAGIFVFIAYLGYLYFLAQKAFRCWQKQVSLQSEQNLQNQQSLLLKGFALGVFAVVMHIFWGGLFEANFDDAETLHMFCFFIGLFLYLDSAQAKQV